jgi:hypothetical protein
VGWKLPEISEDGLVSGSGDGTSSDMEFSSCMVMTDVVFYVLRPVVITGVYKLLLSIRACAKVHFRGCERGGGPCGQ